MGHRAAGLLDGLVHTESTMLWRTWLGFETRVAVRFLREGRLQTVLIMVGVAAGVAVIAYISALVTGLQKNTFDKTLGAFSKEGS